MHTQFRPAPRVYKETSITILKSQSQLSDTKSTVKKEHCEKSAASLSEGETTRSYYVRLHTTVQSVQTTTMFGHH